VKIAQPCCASAKIPRTGIDKEGEGGEQPGKETIEQNLVASGEELVVVGRNLQMGMW